MRLSEKLDEVLVSTDELEAIEFLVENADTIRQALRDSERYRWLRDYNADTVPLPAWIAGPGNDRIDEDWLTGEKADAAIDAAMDRREGEWFKMCRCHTADARRLCPDKRECMTAEAHSTTPEDADDA